jgi:hypothetical protein
MDNLKIIKEYSGYAFDEIESFKEDPAVKEIFSLNPFEPISIIIPLFPMKSGIFFWSGCILTRV